MGAAPGPATQLAKGYASLFQKTLRKGLYFGFLYVLDFGKKGPFFRECQQFRKKRVFFLVIFTGKGLFSSASRQHFSKKGVFFPSVNISERGNFFISRTIIRPPFACEWPDRGAASNEC